MDAEEIRRRVREKGQLPSPVTLRRLLRQRGGNHACLVCDEAIPPARMEFELTDGTHTYHVHPECFTVWMRTLEGDASS